MLSVQETLEHTSSSYALVFFTPYRPWLLEKDLAFFDAAKEGGFRVEKIFEKLMDEVLFKEDRGVSETSCRRLAIAKRILGRDIAENSIWISTSMG